MLNIWAVGEFFIQSLAESGMNDRPRNPRMSEWISDRCKRTGIGNTLPITKQIKHGSNILLLFYYTVLLL